jgi:hypothetical protein
MTSTKRVVSLIAAGGLALTIAGAASTTAGASVRSHPILSAKVAAPRPGGPMIRATGAGAKSVTAGGVPTISLNWSGYAALSTKSKFTYVHSEWVQPAVKCPGVADQLTSNWVGLDGFNDQTVEQDGTFGFCGGRDHNKPLYEAWYEMYPANSVAVFPVHAGDIMEASVRYVTATKLFDLTITDLSTNKTSGTSASCNSCRRNSAEWIIERPAGCNASGCFLFALADFGMTTMTDATAKDGGADAQGIGSFQDSYPIYMVQPLKSGFISLDATGPTDPSTDGFTVTWERAGKPVPITLSAKH